MIKKYKFNDFFNKDFCYKDFFNKDFFNKDFCYKDFCYKDFFRFSGFYKLIIFCTIFAFIGFFTSCKSTNVSENSADDSSKSALSIAEKKPLWVDNLKEEFPEELYIARIGEGFSKKQALADGEENIAKFFGQKVKGETSGYEYISNVAGDKGKKELYHNFSISFDADLFGVEHTKPWYNSNTDSYYICVFINRDKTFEVYKPEILKARKNFLTVYQSCIEEKDYFKQIPLLAKAQELGDVYFETLALGQLIVPGTFDIYKNDLDKIASVNEMKTVAKNKASIKVSVINDINGRVKNCVSSLVTKNGFNLSEKLYMYTIDIELVSNLKEDKEFEIFSVTPFVGISLSNKYTGEELLTYSNNLTRISAYSKNMIDKKMFESVESDLINNFEPLLRDFLNR